MRRALARMLFNCCTDHAEPEWTAFDAIELSACVIVHKGEDHEHTEALRGPITDYPDKTAPDFYTVYGHLKTGGIDAITDCPTAADALAIGTLFAQVIAEAHTLPSSVIPTPVKIVNFLDYGKPVDTRQPDYTIEVDESVTYRVPVYGDEAALIATYREVVRDGNIPGLTMSEDLELIIHERECAHIFWKNGDVPDSDEEWTYEEKQRIADAVWDEPVTQPSTRTKKKGKKA